MVRFFNYIISYDVCMFSYKVLLIFIYCREWIDLELVVVIEEHRLILIGRGTQNTVLALWILIAMPVLWRYIISYDDFYDETILNMWMIFSICRWSNQLIHASRELNIDNFVKDFLIGN